jgi:transcriptional regulator with XRE-family HTH domain
MHAAPRADGGGDGLMNDDATIGEETKAQSSHSLDQLVGAAVKSDRKLAGLTLAELSAKSGVSTAMISKIERGQVSASLSTLNALSRAIGVPIINFFAETVERKEVSFVKAGEGVRVRRRGSTYGHTYKMIGRVTTDRVEFETFMITLEAPVIGQPMFQHAGIEFIHMVAGTMTYRCGNETFELAPGDSLTFETQAPHGPVQIGPGQVSFLTVIARPLKE